MTRTTWRVDPRVAVVLPTADDAKPDEGWARHAATGLLDGRGEEHAGVEAVVAALEDASARARGAIGAQVLLWPSGVAGATVLRVATAAEPLGDDALQAWGETGAATTRTHAFDSEGLGRGQVDLQLRVEAERTLAIARWSWVKPGGSVLAVLGPIPHEALAVVLPTAAAVLDAVSVEGLDADGVAFGAQQSLLAEREPVESWRAVVEATSGAARDA